MFHGRTYWIVGASEGLGRALANALAREGARLILSARRAAPLDALAADLADARALPLDVTDATSVSVAAERAGQIDGIIWCVGSYEPMTAQSWAPESAAQMGEVNYIGALRLLGHVVPGMAKRRAGHVIIIGSLSGYRGLPGAIGYGASKAALMHLAENMRADLKGTGVKVQLANPGFIRTRLSDKNDFDMPQLMEPEAAAARVVKQMRSNRFATAFPAPFAWVFTLGRHLPVALFQKLF
ncbi:MAG: SDR family NAD(P)-dependent oxidoreductase [Brevirhabdus sp.]